MSLPFQTGVIRPIECFREGYELIKDQYWLFFGITVVGMLIGGFVPFGIILGAMYCGIYYAFSRKVNGERPEFADLFKGFDYFLPGLVVTLFTIVPSLLFGIPLQAFNFYFQFVVLRDRANPPDINTALTFLTIVGSLAVVFTLVVGSIHALLLFAYPLVVEHKLTGIEAVKTSARAVWANLGAVVGLILVEFVLGLLGILLCYVGVFFVLPIMFAGVFVAYRKVFPHTTRTSNLPPPPPNFANYNG